MKQEEEVGKGMAAKHPAVKPAAASVLAVQCSWPCPCSQLYLSCSRRASVATHEEEAVGSGGAKRSR